MKVDKKLILTYKEVSNSIRYGKEEWDFYPEQEDKEAYKKLNEIHKEDICKFLENIPYLRTESKNIFKNEDWQTLFHLLPHALHGGDTQENRQFIYYVIKYAPLPFKFKFKYWFFKKVLYRFFNKILGYIFRISEKPKSSLNDYAMVRAAVQETFKNIVQDTIVEDKVKNKEKVRNWEWVNPKTEEKMKKVFQKEHVSP
jgi:hypothetical protein